MDLKIRFPSKGMLFLFTAVFLAFGVWGRETGFKYFKNYSPKEYDRQPQNWWILQDNRGVIYVGNNGGVLEFDGVSWRTIEIPNTVVRSMAAADDGTIYVGGRSEFGFLSPDSNGNLAYQSLLGHLNKNQKNFKEVWKIYSTPEGVYFQAKEILFRWNSGEIREWKPAPKFHFSYFCNGKLFIKEDEKGLKQMVRDSLELVSGGEMFADKLIYMMVPYDSKKLLIGTRENGFYVYDGIKPEPFPTDVDDYLKKKKLYYGVRLSSGDFALATLDGGLVIINYDGKLEEIISKAWGLQDESVKFVLEDVQKNLWLGLEKGISKIEYTSPLSIYNEQAGLPGLVLSVSRHQKDVYAGCSNGLYLHTTTGKFRPVPGISDKCWDLLSVGDSLLAASTNGVFQVDKNNTQQLIKGRVYVLMHSRKDPNRTWAGTINGLISLYLDLKDKDKEKRSWVKEHTFEKTGQEIRTIVEDKKGNLWLGTREKGVLKVDFNDRGSIINPVVTPYHTDHGLPPGEVNVFMAAGHVMFATQKKGHTVLMSQKRPLSRTRR